MGRYRGRVRGISVLLLLALLWSVFATPALAAEQAAATGETAAVRTVRIGYIDYEGFFDKGEDGTFSGYGVDLLRAVASHTDWQFEYVFDSFANHLENLKTGRIDFICHAQKTPEREENYLFSKYSTGAESSVLYARRDDDRFYYGDTAMLDGVTIAFLEGSFQNSEFARYARENSFAYNTLYCDSQAACFDALDEGRVDAVAMGSLGGVEDYKVISMFGSDPFYMMSGRDNAALMDEMDSALGQVFAADPTFIASLFTKYYSQKTASSGMRLTRAEAQYIASVQHGTPLVVGLMQGRSPVSYRDEQGNAAGMMVSLMELVSAKSGLKFSYTFLEPGQTGLDFLQSGGGDLVAGVARSAFASPNPMLLESDSLQDTSIVFVGRAGTEFKSDKSMVVALPQAFIRGEEVVSAVYPNFGFYEGLDTEECLRAIRDGRADLMLQNLYVVRESLQSPLFDGLETFPAYSYPEEEKVVALPGNELLISIINKSIDRFTSEEINDVVLAHTIGKTYRPKLGELAYKYRLALMGIGVLLLLVLALAWRVALVRQRGYAALAKANARLADTNVQLKDAVKQADRASIAKSQFLARMSHEIRTPMNAIVGLTTIAKGHLGDKEQMREYLTKIETSSHVLLGIINDVLDMSAIESDKMKLAKEDFDLKQTLGSLSTLYYSQCRDKGVDFDISADITQEMVVGDSLRVNQILLNLISNAYKFTPAGGSIHVSASQTAVRGDTVYIRFVVQDTGCGMDKEMRERLFRPFEQESGKIAQEHGGSGLGLSIAKNLIEMMHGAITVESEKEVGTTFTVDIPFGVSHKRMSEQPPVHALRALVVAQDATEREYTAVILKRIGVPYEVAATGEEALQKLGAAEDAGQRFDVCFVDWKHGAAEGALRSIRELYPKGELHLVVSVYDQGEAGDEARAAGADILVTKPMFQSTVFDLLSGLSGGEYKTESGNPADYDFTGYRLLLAEDNDLNAEIATELLNMVNMQVDRAENGLLTVERFAASEPGSYALILMDIQMPMLDGYEAARAIRNGPHQEAKTIPIIAMTANAFSSDVSAAISAGMDGHIAKPIDTAILYRTLQETLQGKARQDPQ